MGRIKTKKTKRITRELITKHRELLKETFDENKVIVASLLETESKKLRNVIAGYVTRQMRNREII